MIVLPRELLGTSTDPMQATTYMVRLTKTPCDKDRHYPNVVVEGILGNVSVENSYDHITYTFKVGDEEISVGMPHDGMPLHGRSNLPTGYQSPMEYDLVIEML